MGRKKITFPPGQHPNSLDNLRYHEGRPQVYDEPKKQRNVTVTDKGWKGAREAIKSAGYDSLSEFLELLGRGEIAPPDPPTKE